MSKYKRCGFCSGSGKMMGGGMMLKDCDSCDGEGRFHNEDEIVKNNVVKEVEAIKIKRGRPRRIENE